MAYTTIKYGSSGDDVKRLQEELNKHGYKLDVDGQFGSKTQSAVKDYQKKNNLAVDGVVGKNTWGSLTGNTKKNKTVTTKKQTKTAYKGTKTVRNVKADNRPTYKKSGAVKKAEKKLSAWEKNAPTGYESQYSEEIERILNDILNREKFTYNLNADPLYQQYRDIYTQNGKKAMMDTVGAASALTGGYSNSYAVTAGSQAYEEYLNELNGIALDLRDRAYEQYGDEGDKLFEDITLLRSLDGDDYKKYMDYLERYYKDGEYLLDRLTTMSDAEYERFLQNVDAWEDDRNFAFKEYTDALDREEFKQTMDFKKSEAERDQANEDRDYEVDLEKLEISRNKSSSKSTGSSSSTKRKKVSQTIRYPETYKEFCTATGYPGIMTETEYYAHEEVSKKYGTYKKYLKAMYKIYK